MVPTAISRRSALKALALPCLAGLGAAGCGAASGTVRVAVVWSGWELSQFERVMRAFSDRYGYGYGILSMGDDTTAFLSNQVTAAAQPDVALIPQPGLVRASVPRLAALGWPPQDDAPAWHSLLGGPGSSQYGVWFKTAYESMVWHRDDLPVPPGGWTWDAWVAQCQALAKAGRPPLAIGAADGWVLAGWFSNVLLSIDPAMYRRLAAGYATGHARGSGLSWDNASVREALARLAGLWRITGAFPGGPERALVTQFDESVLAVFQYQQAAMVAGSDFFWPIITQDTSFPAARVRWFPFPSRPPDKAPIIVGGDAAVLFKRSVTNPGARKLIEWLATADAARIWAQAGGFLSINDLVAQRDYPYPPGMRTADLIANVRRGSPDGGAATFDLADLLGGPLGGGDGEGTWKIFTDFFTEVAVRRAPVPRAIDAVVSALDHGAGGS